MTGDELERAIDFLLKSQANLEAQSSRTEEQLKQLAERLDSFADTQANIMQVMTRTFEAQARINESLSTAIAKLAARQEQTAATVDRLSLNVEALAEQTAGTDRRLDALIKIVEGQRNVR